MLAARDFRFQLPIDHIVLFTWYSKMNKDIRQISNLLRSALRKERFADAGKDDIICMVTQELVSVV